MTMIDLTHPDQVGELVPGAAVPGSTPARGEPAALALERPRRLTDRTADDVFCFWGALVGSLALVWLVFAQILPLQGKVGFVIAWYVVFVLGYAILTSVTNPLPVVMDRVAASLISGGALVVGTALVSVVFFTYLRGIPALVHVQTFTQDAAGTGPLTPLGKGGALHAVVGTLIEISLAVLAALPLGVGTAVYMTEVGGRLARVVRTVVEAMTALPSIVAGLFVYTVVLIGLGFQRSGFAGAMAIFVMILPIIARASDVVLRVVPGGLREASLALGASRWQTVWRVVLPTARPGLATALILGVARGIGETSPVLLTSGASTFLNTNPFQDPMNSLPLYIFANVRSGQNILIDRAFGAASILLAIVLGLFVLARFIARQRTTR